MPAKPIPLPNHGGRIARFHDRQHLKIGHPTRKFKLVAGWPTPTLPVDYTKGGTLVYSMDANDQVGDCELAAACHTDNTWTGNVGLESSFALNAILRQYKRLSPHDQGLTDGQMITAWEREGLANNKQAKILDAISIDPTDAATMQSAIYLFGSVQFDLDVPDAWVQSFAPGGIWDATPGVSADSNNGHCISFAGASTAGYTLITWGAIATITQAGVAICDPGAYVCFSLRWFDANGVAPNGLQYDELSEYWVDAGGKALPPWPFSQPPDPMGE